MSNKVRDAFITHDSFNDHQRTVEYFLFLCFLVVINGVNLGEENMSFKPA